MGGLRRVDKAFLRLAATISEKLADVVNAISECSDIIEKGH